MPDYKVVLTWESIYDVAEIAEYIEDKFSRQKADEFQRGIEKEEEREVHILRVLREERDWGNILKNTEDYTYPE